MKTVLGIGNPDEKYAATRHNIGWMVADALSQKMDEKFRKAGFEFWAAEGRLGEHRAALVKTWTYVNGTGRVFPELMKRYGEEILVVCDDVNLPLGSLRFREKGSSGGHNGLRSIEETLGHDAFVRLRIGVGGGRPDPGYVLGRFRKEERETVEETIKTACEAVQCWMDEGPGMAGTKFNRRTEA